MAQYVFQVWLGHRSPHRTRPPSTGEQVLPSHWHPLTGQCWSSLEEAEAQQGSWAELGTAWETKLVVWTEPQSHLTVLLPTALLPTALLPTAQPRVPPWCPHPVFHHVPHNGSDQERPSTRPMPELQVPVGGGWA